MLFGNKKEQTALTCYSTGAHWSRVKRKNVGKQDHVGTSISEEMLSSSHTVLGVEDHNGSQVLGFF